MKKHTVIVSHTAAHSGTIPCGASAFNSLQRSHRRAFISMKMLGTAVVVVLGVGAVGYVISRDGSLPVITQEAKGLARDVTTWTDKQIVAYPDLYFGYAIEQFKDKEKALDANRLGIIREKVNAAQNHATHAATATALSTVLDKAKTAYKAAPAVTNADGKESGKKFPIVCGQVTFKDQNDFNLQIGIALRKLEVEKKLAESFKNLETKLESALLKLASQKTEIQLQLATAEGNLKLIEAKKTIGEIEKIAADIKNIMINCDVIAKETAPEKFTLVDAAGVASANAASAANNAAVEAFLAK